MATKRQEAVSLHVRVSEANSELREDLLKVPARQRAERLRAMATVGLLISRQSSSSTAGTAPVPVPAVAAAETRRSSLIRNILNDD